MAVIDDITDSFDVINRHETVLINSITIIVIAVVFPHCRQGRNCNLGLDIMVLIPFSFKESRIAVAIAAFFCCASAAVSCIAGDADGDAGLIRSSGKRC